MEWLTYIVAAVFCLAGAACVASIVVSIPGGWIMLGLAVLIEVTDSLYLPPEARQTFDWWTLGICAGLLGLGEAVELAAGAAGAKTGGAGRRGMVGALIGGILGALLCTFLLPLPIVGTLVGALAGTFVGAIVGETSGVSPRSMRGSIKPAVGATIGRVVGAAAKIALTIAVWIVLSFAAFLG